MVILLAFQEAFTAEGEGFKFQYKKWHLTASNLLTWHDGLYTSTAQCRLEASFRHLLKLTFYLIIIDES